MFKKFTLKNYKTHKLTTIELGSVTLLIGNNSSGKTNLLSGIQHFANLVRRGNPSRESHSTVRSSDYFPHKHRLANDNEKMSIEVVWLTNNTEVIYKLELYTNNNLEGNVGCCEKININISGNEQELKNGFENEKRISE
jgi:AAA15 family ATPase/GTPase